MTKKEILKWRLSKLPSSEEVLALVKDGVITKDEAREILFSTELPEERDEKSLKAEIKFLREVIERLSNNQQTRVIEVVREAWKPYYQQPWCQPYVIYCSSGGGSIMTASTASAAGQITASNNLGFSNIKTF